jgi:outer membrane protein assembly factor BamB
LAAGSTVGLPPVTSTGAEITALWQAPLTEAMVTGDLVVGLAAGRPAVLEAISELTGRQRWTASLPAEDPYVANLFAAGGVVVVEVGNVSNAPAGIYEVTRDVVFDALSGRQLWDAGVPGGPAVRVHPAITYAQGLIVSGDALGGVIARKALTGAVAWHTPPASCAQDAGGGSGYDDRLADDGGLLVVSYRCDSDRRSQVILQRLAPRTGALRWQWRSIAVGEQSFIEMSVEGAGTEGELVVLSGQAGEPMVGRYLRSLPRPRVWPTSLDAFGGTDLLLALDARTGTPRWTELGGQLEKLTLTDGATCETVNIGFECRDDQSGLHTRPILTTGLGEGSSPPYERDGTAGISGSLAGVVLSQAPSGAVSIGVFPLRGGGAIAHATVQLGDSTYGGARCKNFIVGAGPIAGGGTLLLLRRVDVAGYPLVALRVSSSRP